MSNLIAFDSQYISEQIKNINRAQQIMEEAIRTLKKASAHEGWKCSEIKNINDNMSNITNKLTRLNNGITGTAEALSKGVERFTELETRAENQTNSLSNSIQNQYGFTASDRNTNTEINLPATLIPIVTNIFKPAIIGLPKWFSDTFIDILRKKFPYLFGNSTATTDTTTTTTQTPTPTPAPAPEPEPTPAAIPTPEPITLIDGNFDSAMEVVFGNEGGYSNHPNDPGGATNMGITHYTLDTAYQRGIVSHNDVTQLTVNEAKDIYREMYWKPSNADKMPDPLATIYFDTVVLCGQYGGGRLLQRALNNLGQSVVVDGSVGPQTLTAMNEQLKSPEDVKALCNELCNVRQAYHEADRNADTFLAGWTNRVNRMRDLGNSYAV